MENNKIDISPCPKCGSKDIRIYICYGNYPGSKNYMQGFNVQTSCEVIYGKDCGETWSLPSDVVDYDLEYHVGCDNCEKSQFDYRIDNGEVSINDLIKIWNDPLRKRTYEIKNKKTYINQAYTLYPGRFQSPHKGHMYIFNETLKNNEPICIAIRDITPDEKNPFTAQQVKTMWEKIYEGNDLVKVIIIPDIKAVKFGRNVGYEISEITNIPSNITNISATEIRNQITNNKNDWKEFVDKSIHEILPSYLTPVIL